MPSSDCHSEGRRRRAFEDNYRFHLLWRGQLHAGAIAGGVARRRIAEGEGSDRSIADEKHA